MRTFEDRPAVREQVPLLLGLIGPSGTGKTYSALRLATGIQRVSGGDIFVIDTESRRSLHYASPSGSATAPPGTFKFRHVPFGAPFSPIDYLEAIEHCIKKGAKTIVVDSTSHEHEGPGGVLEMHEAEVQKLSKGDPGKAERVKMLAWAKPKAQRRRLINTVLQMSANFIFCFRSKEKIKIVKGAEPEPLGFMPIAGEEFVYEMVLKCLLLPGANGFPTWESNWQGEKMMIKIPQQFRSMFLKKDVQLSEDVGEALAKWAAGEERAKVSVDVADLLKRYTACSERATYRTLEEERKEAWTSLGKDDKIKLREASEAADERMKAAEAGALAAADEEATNGAGSELREPGSDG